jgi:ribosomal protein L7Ae-like RNA K-turn-binding protein
MSKDLILQMLGLCQRARKLVSGETFVLEKIKSNEAKIVFLASDAGLNTTKRTTDKCEFYHVEIINSFNTEELSQAIGKSNRKVIAVTDRGFAEKIRHYNI